MKLSIVFRVQYLKLCRATAGLVYDVIAHRILSIGLHSPRSSEMRTEESYMFDCHSPGRQLTIIWRSRARNDIFISSNTGSVHKLFISDIIIVIVH